MIDFFMTQKYKVYSKSIIPCGAGEDVEWNFSRTIKAYIEPIDGEKLLGTELGNKEDISLIIYTKNPINKGERVYITSSQNQVDGFFEIRDREFYRMPFFNYFKGYLVKADEN